MRNEIFRDADRISLPVPADTPAGAPVLVGVTATAEGQGGNAEGRATVWRKGEYSLSVTGAVASEGLPIYITSANALTTTTTGNTLFGYAHGTKGSGAGDLNAGGRVQPPSRGARQGLGPVPP
ncbi:capsid cement protein [Geodermatophilus sp. SYSU D00708]